MAHMVNPIRIYSVRVLPAEEVVGRVGWGSLVHVFSIFGDILEVAAPFVPGVTSFIERMLFQPSPGCVASLPVARSVALVQPDQLIEKTQRRGDDAAVLLPGQDLAGFCVDPEGPRRVLVISLTHMLGQGIGAVGRSLQILTLSGHLIKKCITNAQLAHLVGFDASVEIPR